MSLRNWLPHSALVALLALVPLSTSNNYYMDIIVQIFMWGAAATAWNIVGGYAGQFSLGHSAFFGIGAYTSSLLFIAFGLSPWIGMLAGGGLSALFALIIGYLSVRLRGPFFTLATIALAEVLQILAIYWRDLTGGGSGVLLPFRPGFANFMFESKQTYAYVALGFLLAVLAVAYVIERSRLGYYLVAIREEEDAARALGVRVLWMKLLAIVISAFFTSLIGTFYAQYILWLEPPYAFSLELSIQFALMAIIGGLGTLPGPLLGAVLITPLGIFLRAWLGAAASGLYIVFYGIILVIVVLFMRQGIAVEFRLVFRRWVSLRGGLASGG